MTAKIVIIGAGSLVFSSRLTADLLTYDSMQEAHFALVDIDPERLEYAGRIVARILKEGDYTGASYSLHEDRRTALEDADYVISSLLVGGFAAIEQEIDIAKRYGVDQAIGDTPYPGWHHALSAYATGSDRHSPRYYADLPGCTAAQLHQPHGDVVLGYVSGGTGS